MEKSLFAGLTILEPGESLSTDSGAFTGADRRTIDRLLEVGAKTHRHTGLDGLTNPAAPASAAVVASGGSLAPGLGISVGYTLEDENGGETMLSPAASVTTGQPIQAPQAAPSGEASNAGGSLQVNTYFYAVTWTDGEGGETPLGPSVTVERAPGFASGQAILTQLAFGMAPAGAVGWRLYRAIGGGAYNLLATGGTGDNEFVDDGSHSLNCDVHPPVGEENTTRGISTLLVTLPTGLQAGTAFINLYASVTGDFGGGSFLAQYPLASAGQIVAFASLELAALSPPDTNLSIGGAHQIDPDAELIDWHWKRPVASASELPAGEEGDVRMVMEDTPPAAYFFHNGAWELWTGGVGSPGPKGDPGTPGSAAVGPWVKMTAGLQGAWVGTQTPLWPPAYRIYGDKVELAGGVASGADGSLIYTLPSAAAPLANVRLGFGEGVSNAGITFEVNTKGEIVCVERNGAICYLTGLSFPLSTPP
jgi:hypothetical protein